MGRLVENQRARLFLYRLEAAASSRSLGGQETFEDEPVRRQSRRRQRRDQRAGARHRDHPDTQRLCLAHQVEAGIGNQRGTGVRDQRDVLPTLQPGDEAPALLALVVLVAGRQWRLDAEVLEQPDRMAGILRSHQGHLPQHPQGARADVVEIADRGRHYEQSAC